MTDRGNRVDQQLGNYRLLSVLGEGGFAEVYLGEHVHLGTLAAIKVLNTQLVKDDIGKFRTEARTIAHLEHPNIVRVLEFGVEDRTPFLVLSYAPNGTLRKRHPKGSRPPLTMIASYVRQVADALQYAHDEKLIHRDIKPENMLVGRRNEILLSDFGIAIVAQSSRYHNPQDMAGTMIYMAPEQIQGKPRTASDQYSLGVVVFEWLTGKRPFYGSLSELIGQHISTPPPSLREINPAIALPIEEVVMKALSKDPKKRFAAISEFATALEKAIQSNQDQPVANITMPSTQTKQPDSSVSYILSSSSAQLLQIKEIPPIQNQIPAGTGQAITPPEPQAQTEGLSSPQRTEKRELLDALTLLEQEHYTKALAALDQLLKRNPTMGYAYNAKGLALYRLERYSEAIASLEQALAQNPIDVTAHFGRGLALEKLQRSADALLAYEQVLQIDVSYKSIWRKKGDVLMSLKRFEEALAAYEQALKLDSNDADAHIGKGIMLKRLGRLK